jgi:alkylated DNA repair dioxygenase AlkB
LRAEIVDRGSRHYSCHYITMQYKFFDSGDNEDALKRLEGLRYQQELIQPADEDALVKHLQELPFQAFDFHGFKGKRRVVSFGWRYDYSGSQLRKADEIPGFLLPLRTRVASFADLKPTELQHVLVTEYEPGTGIGWHRDKAVFGQVIGVSLLSPCVLRFRRKVNESSSAEGRRRQWERVNLFAEPCSAYLLSGSARLEWEHSILRVDALRYAITFRSVREG